MEAQEPLSTAIADANLRNRCSSGSIFLMKPFSLQPSRSAGKLQRALNRAHSPGGRHVMPERKTVKRAARRKREGKSPSTQAGEFVREEMHHIREGKHGARSPQQAIAIGLSKARSAGVDLKPPQKGKASAATRRNAANALKRSRSGKKPSTRRSRATSRALRREGRGAASRSALSSQARAAARKRSARDRSAAARKAARTRARRG